MHRRSRSLYRKRTYRAKEPMESRGIPMIRNAQDPEVSVIIPVANERRTLPAVLRSVAGLVPSMEVIVVTNGSRDGTREIAVRSGARVIDYPEKLGHDVGRSVGASAANGDILLFVDGDFAIERRLLLPFVRACRKGTDIALNRYGGFLGTRSPHDVVTVKHVLNLVMRRGDLRGASLTSVPHAMKRGAIRRVGPELLSVPPLAQAVALMRGLKVEAVSFVPVGRQNPIRRSSPDPIAGLIVGDHAEALFRFMDWTDSRGGRAGLSAQTARTEGGSS